MTGELEELRAELVKISNDAPKNSHNEVADNLDISLNSLSKIRAGERLTVDNSENREKIKDIISEYLGIIRCELQKLSEYDT